MHSIFDLSLEKINLNGKDYSMIPIQLMNHCLFGEQKVYSNNSHLRHENLNASGFGINDINFSTYQPLIKEHNKLFQND